MTALILEVHHRQSQDHMSKNTFNDDLISRRLMTVLLVLQITAMAFVLVLSFQGRSFLAFVISSLTLVLFIAVLLWLYFRYRNLPIVREKSTLQQRILKFQKSAQAEANIILASTKKREELIQAENNEVETALSNTQDAYIEYGLANASIKDAAIAGIGPKLKERLAEHGVHNAAQVNEQIAELAGFGETKRQALLSGRNSVMAALENTKPTSLRDERLKSIKHKYQDLHAQNDVSVRDALESRNLLEHELKLFVPQLGGMAPVNFFTYLSKSLAARGMIAASIAFLLIITQVVSSLTATSASIMALNLPERLALVGTPTQTILASSPATMAPSPMMPSTIPNTPMNTLPPIATATSGILASQPTLPSAISACVPRNTARETALVVGIIDGDTIDVQIGDRAFRVRYIGVNTPEQDEAFFSEATAYNQKLIENKTVTLVKDQSETDRFGRLLRYVLLEDIFVNYELVKSGYASASAFAPDIACSTAFEVAQGQAQMASLGLWMATPGAYIAPVTGGEDTNNCDPSYPGVCIPPAPPDLDCKDIPYKRFTVLPPDPHGFDRDG